MGRKLGHLSVFFGGGELSPQLAECGLAESYLHAKFHLGPSKRLATIHQRHREADRQTDMTNTERSDSIERTVVQMVAQKSTDFNEVFTVRLSDEPYMRYYEHHPPHLINVGTLPSESRNTENVILQ